MAWATAPTITRAFAGVNQLSAADKAKQAALNREIAQLEAQNAQKGRQEQSVVVGNYTTKGRQGIEPDGSIFTLKGPLTNASIPTGTTIENAGRWGDAKPRDFPLQRRVQKSVTKTNYVLPFIYGIPHEFDYTYPIGPGTTTREIDSDSQWLYSRDLQEVPINYVDFIEIRYSGSTEQSIEASGFGPICNTFTALWIQIYQGNIRSDGSSPDYFYNEISVTECEPPEEPPEYSLRLHNATFIEHKIKVGPTDNFLTYTETFSHGTGFSNRTSNTFTVTEIQGDPTAGYIAKGELIIHPDELKDPEDRNPNITVQRGRGGNSVPYSWSLASSVDIIFGSGTRDLNAARPGIGSATVADSTQLSGFTQSQIDDFNQTGTVEFVEQDTLTEGGSAFSSTGSVQIPIQRENGKECPANPPINQPCIETLPYISSSAEIDFIAARQIQTAYPTLGAMASLPSGHDFYDRYLDLPYQPFGVADWLTQNGGAVDTNTGDLLNAPLRMPLAIAQRLEARGIDRIDSVSHPFIKLVGGPPTLLIPNGLQEYAYQAWAFNNDDEGNTSWELRGFEDDETDDDWRFEPQGACSDAFLLKYLANLSGGFAYEASKGELEKILSNSGPDDVDVVFTRKPIDEDGGCAIGEATDLEKTFPPLTDSINDAEILAAAPNKVPRGFGQPTEEDPAP